MLAKLNTEIPTFDKKKRTIKSFQTINYIIYYFNL